MKRKPTSKWLVFSLLLILLTGGGSAMYGTDAEGEDPFPIDDEGAGYYCKCDCGDYTGPLHPGPAGIFGAQADCTNAEAQGHWGCNPVFKL